MAAPSLTYTLVNSTTADAAQVMQNFNDLLNGITDGSKDLTINAATIAGALTANGDITLGNFSTDVLTINANLSSSITLALNNTYDLGALGVGLASVYLGSAGGKTTKLVSGATTSYTLTTPVAVGTARSRVLASATGALSFEEVRSPFDANNYSLTASVAANALTVALKGSDGNDPSSTNVVELGFRSATAATGTTAFRSATSATSVVISSGSTLGTVSAVASNIYVYAIDNAGTVELGISSSLIDEGSRQSTTAEGGAGAADSGYVIYSTTTRTNVGIRLIGRLQSTQATAGTWATAISEVSLLPFKLSKPPTVQTFTSGTGTYTTPNGVVYLKVRVSGGGSGGGGGGQAGTAGNGTAGSTSTFGTSLLTANGGAAASSSGQSGGNGGTAAISSPAYGTAISGGHGQDGLIVAGLGNFSVMGGFGGSNPLGGAGGGSGQAGNGTGYAAAANSGAGGGGGGSTTTASVRSAGSGGAAGGFVDAVIPNPSATYSYAIGGGGSGGGAGTDGYAGGAGGSGYIEVVEFYQ